MQERRMLLAAAAAAATATTSGFGFSEAVAGVGTGTDACGTNIPCTGYYLLSPEARQRLANAVPEVGSDTSSPYEAAALLHSGSWSFTGFGTTSYIPQLPAYSHSSSTTDLIDRRRNIPPLPMIENESTIRSLGRDVEPFTEGAYEVGYYHGERPGDEESPSRLETLYPDTTSPTLSSSNFISRLSPGFESPPGNIIHQQRTPRNSPGLEVVPVKSTNSSPSKQVGKRTKKPFTIENIIAPDEEEKASRESFEVVDRKTTTLLSMPKPLYAARYPLPGVTIGSAMQRPPYGTTT